MPGIREWAEEQLESGVSKSELRQAMKKKGYSQKAMDFLDEIETPYEKSLMQKRTRRTLLEAAALMIAIAALAVGGLYTYNMIHIPTPEEVALNLSKLYGNVTPMKVVGNSMAPTFKDGDIVFVAVEHYSNNSITRNDVAMIKFKLADDSVAKRVAGIPLEKIDLTEKYLSGTLLLKQLQYYDYVIPNNTMIVLGDNLPESIDSRQYGVVPVDYAEGKLVG